jgi:hypothetical protein
VVVQVECKCGCAKGIQVANKTAEWVRQTFLTVPCCRWQRGSNKNLNG